MFQKIIEKRKKEHSYRKGVSMMQSGRPDLAIGEFSRAIDLQPDFMEAHLARGICLATIASDEKALEDLKFAVDVDPSIKEAYYWLGVIYLRKKDLNLAFTNADKALELNPGEPANYLLRGCIFLEKNCFEDVINDMNLAIKQGFEVDGYSNRALVYEKMGEEGLAIVDWTKVIQIAPKHPKAYLKRGLLYKNSGKIKEAIGDLEEGLKYPRLIYKSLFTEA